MTLASGAPLLPVSEYEEERLALSPLARSGWTPLWLQDAGARLIPGKRQQSTQVSIKQSKTTKVMELGQWVRGNLLPTRKNAIEIEKQQGK